MLDHLQQADGPDLVSNTYSRNITERDDHNPGGETHDVLTAGN